jgi:hypothetical protein
MAGLFDHLVGACEQCGWDGNYQLVLCPASAELFYAANIHLLPPPAQLFGEQFFTLQASVVPSFAQLPLGHSPLFGQFRWGPQFHPGALPVAHIARIAAQLPGHVA